MERYYDEPYKNGLISLIFKEFFMLLLICTIGMTAGMMFVPPQLAFIAGIGAIAVLIFAAVIKRRQFKQLSRGNSYTVAFLMGISTFPTIMYYISVMGSVMVLYP